MIVNTKGVCGGEPRIDGHRITVKNILGVLFNTNEGIKAILETFPTLSKNDISEVECYLDKILDKKTDK